MIYVMGAGHSGSTILGMTLGNCAGNVLRGEVARWLRYDGVPRLRGRGSSGAFGERVRERVDVPREVLRRACAPARAVHRGLSRVRRLARPAAAAASPTDGRPRISAVRSRGWRACDTSSTPRTSRGAPGSCRSSTGSSCTCCSWSATPGAVVASYGRENVPHKQTWKMGMTNAYLWLTYLLSVRGVPAPAARRGGCSSATRRSSPIRRGDRRDPREHRVRRPEVPDLAELRDRPQAFRGERLLRQDVVVRCSPIPEEDVRGARG